MLLGNADGRHATPSGQHPRHPTHGRPACMPRPSPATTLLCGPTPALAPGVSVYIGSVVEGWQTRAQPHSPQVLDSGLPSWRQGVLRKRSGATSDTPVLQRWLPGQGRARRRTEKGHAGSPHGESAGHSGWSGPADDRHAPASRPGPRGAHRAALPAPSPVTEPSATPCHGVKSVMTKTKHTKSL